MRTSVRAIVIQDNALLVMRRNKQGLRFYSLVGGGIDSGETATQVLEREVAEESSIAITNPKLVFTHNGSEFGQQDIYLCDYASGTPALQPGTNEARETFGGKNTYQPVWLPLAELDRINLLPVELKEALANSLQHGFPSPPIELKIGA